jgi:Secretion system C-terminal sorting domain
MNKLYMLLGIFGSAFLLVSNTTNPPDAHTGAPGELFCANCHTTNGSSLAGTISVEGFPASITPGETYPLTVVNRNTNGGGAKAGFQITILGPLNTKAGDMSMPSANSATSMLNGRQYFEHHPATSYPDSNVVKWTVLWKAPALTGGSIITWYANGIIANGNVKQTGDKTTSSKGTGTVILSATQYLVSDTPSIYPNPGSGMIHIVLPDQTFPSGQVRFYDLSGKMVLQTKIEEGVIYTPDLLPGIYLTEFKNGDRSYVARWSKI